MLDLIDDGLALLPGLDFPRFVGMEAMHWAVHLFDEQLGLPVPPLPACFADSMRVLAPGVVGTREEAPSPYDLAWFLRELERGPVADYLLAGHAGHGVNSWAIHYYLLRAPLALFVQIPWGGAYMENGQPAVRIAHSFELAAALIQAPALARLPAGERLVIVASDAVRSGWARQHPSGADAPALQPTADPLAAALLWLNAGPPPCADIAAAAGHHLQGPIWG